jgi:uncharacterized membrane protein
MNKLDDAIRQALSREDAALLEGLGADQPLHSQLMQTFQGKLAWMNVVGWIAGFVLAAVLFFCGWQFLQAPEIRDMLIWGAAAGLAAAGIVLTKLWFWMELQKNSIVREIKRLELQVARLSARGGQ